MAGRRSTTETPEHTEVVEAPKVSRNIKDGEPVEQVVDSKAYPERPYADAITDEHRALLGTQAPKA